jgi:hypothetical protein
MNEQPPEASPSTPPAKDYTRELGVVECFVAITNECQSGPVRTMASHALEAIKSGGPEVMRQQVYYVLTALQGWRGERASQVHASLTKYYRDTAPPAPPTSSNIPD